MNSIRENTTIKEYQEFVKEVYGFSNDRYFNLWDMVSNIERFTMRGLKGIRKKDIKKTKINLLIALSWFMSTMNQLHIDIENEIWKRFPYLCSYCGFGPCSCREKKIEGRKEVLVNDSKKPKTLQEFQRMFKIIYPPDARTIEYAGVHLAEEIGEFSEAVLVYRGKHKDEDFKNIKLEAADFYSCMAGVFNSIEIDMAKELSIMFSNNCHICKKSPCICDFEDITRFKS